MDDKRRAPSESHGDRTAETKVPALFATIHFKSDHRPDGYTVEEVAEMNRIANLRDSKSRK